MLILDNEHKQEKLKSWRKSLNKQFLLCVSQAWAYLASVFSVRECVSGGSDSNILLVEGTDIPC